MVESRGEGGAFDEPEFRGVPGESVGDGSGGKGWDSRFMLRDIGICTWLVLDGTSPSSTPPSAESSLCSSFKGPSPLEPVRR
jgi:hypothetical protein